MNRPRKYYLVANTSGYISVYAILVLQISLCFMTAVFAYAEASLLSKQPQDYLEVYLIRHVRERFEKMELDPESWTWKQYQFDASYEEQIATIKYIDSKQSIKHTIRIEYDDICQCVMKIAYPSTS